MGTKTPSRAVIYCRISQDRKGEGLGVERQRRDCEAWAKAHGWTVAATLVENNTSAYSSKVRPQYRAMLAGLADGSYDGVVAWHPDRLHRNVKELVAFIDVVGIDDKNKIEVATVKAGLYDLGTSAGRMTAVILGAVAQQESEHKSDRIRRKTQELAESGKPGGGARPYGFMADKVTIDPVEAANIREAAERLLAGQSLRSIMLDWQARGIKSSKGNDWSTTALRTMLRSERIAGIRIHQGATYPAVWPAIIDNNTHLAIKAVLAANATGKDTSVRTFLLTGLLKCGVCGKNLTSQVSHSDPKHPRRRYKCDLVSKGGCGKVGIDANGTEEVVGAIVLEALDNWNFEAGEVDTTEIQALEARKRELAKNYATGDLDMDSWKAAANQLDKLLMDARTKIVDVTQSRQLLTIDPEHVKANWHELTLDVKRAAISAVLVSVTIEPVTVKTWKFDPRRIPLDRIDWRR